jgi:hypothetical protein
MLGVSGGDPRLAALALALSFGGRHECEKLLGVVLRGEFAPDRTNLEGECGDLGEVRRS